MLRTIAPQDIRPRGRSALDPETLTKATGIVHDVRTRGEVGLREYAAQLDGLMPHEPLVLGRAALATALEGVSQEARDLLERTADRIRRFADAERACVSDLRFDIPGGAAGHTVQAVQSAGCYVPAGRYPLVSSMLMTVVTARAAGVERVWAASPKPSEMMLAAASVAGADALLAVGGAHAIAAFAYGVGPAPACDVIVGPGNRWVTAAKYVVSADVRIDMLAGPSELLVVADESADPALIAADLLAQAEHDADACPMLVTTSASLIDAVQGELSRQLETLPTRETAVAALRNGFAVCAGDLDEAVRLANELAPEHLELHVRDAGRLAQRIRACGCLFVGARSAEALGDYSAGPNHTLPTGGTARFASGLSVGSFLRQHTWVDMEGGDAGQALYEDASALARLEGLEAHARSAELRRRVEGKRPDARPDGNK